MYIAKTIILFVSFLIANDGPFRGKSLNDVLSGTIPISYSNFISEQYNIPISQLNAQRGSYLIISPDNMLDHLGELLSFKKSQGFDVYIERLSNIGSTAEEIKQLIENTLLEDPMLEYVLLIGDVDGVAAMPSFYYGPENDVTDQRYTHILGGDFFPDVFIGRFSIDSISELVVMIRKTINYHRQPLSSNADWLDKALVVAGNYSNTVPIPITPKWTSYWVRDLLYDNGFTSVDTVFYPPIQQGASLIQNYINNGVGIVNYRGWGDANGWHYPEFHVGDVVSLNNGWMTPVFTSFVCNSKDFANNLAVNQNVLEAHGLIKKSNIADFNLSNNLNLSGYFRQRIVEFSYPIRFNKNSKFIIALSDSRLNCKVKLESERIKLHEC